MGRWRVSLITVWCVAVAASVALFFVPWRFVIAGYEFPYHGRPALLAACLALIVGAAATFRGWRGRWRRWPWAVVCGLLGVQVGLQMAFICGPDTVTATGSTVGPWGVTPVQFAFPVPATWGIYASAGAASVGLLAGAALTLWVGRQDAEPAAAPDPAA